MADQPAPVTHAPNKLNKRLYVVFTVPVDGDVAGDRAVVRAEHLEYQYELERRGIMFAAGPFLNADGQPNGSGLIIYRADSLEAATEIAKNDPFHRHGFRTFTIMPWRVSEGTFSVRVNYSSGTYHFD
ncbi:MAG: YciI family protein [Hyphomicrobiaceae bacterium]